MEQVVRNKRYYGYRLQPRRSVKRRATITGLAEQVCIYVAGFDMFKDYACISSLDCDLNLIRTLDIRESIDIDTKDRMYSLVSNNITSDLQLCKYTIIKICTPGHIAVALWDKLTNIVELFDSSGVHNMVPVILKALEISLIKYGITKDNIRIVNHENLQALPEDEYCQVWIYLYLYMRLIDNFEPADITDIFSYMDPKQKFDLIERFRDFLLYNTKNKNFQYS